MNNLWTALAVILHHYPLEPKVEILIKPLEDRDAQFEEVDGVYVITIDVGLPENAWVETLVHEMAHAYLNTYEGPSQDQVWGVVFASLYKLILGEH